MKICLVFIASISQWFDFIIRLVHTHTHTHTHTHERTHARTHAVSRVLSGAAMTLRARNVKSFEAVVLFSNKE